MDGGRVPWRRGGEGGGLACVCVGVWGAAAPAWQPLARWLAGWGGWAAEFEGRGQRCTFPGTPRRRRPTLCPPLCPCAPPAQREDKERKKAFRAAGKGAKPLWEEDGRRRTLLDKYDEEEEEMMQVQGKQRCFG